MGPVLNYTYFNFAQGSASRSISASCGRQKEGAAHPGERARLQLPGAKDVGGARAA